MLEFLSERDMREQGSGALAALGRVGGLAPVPRRLSAGAWG